MITGMKLKLKLITIGEMKNNEEHKAFMREYMRNYRATMSHEKYLQIRAKDNIRKRQRYYSRTDEQKAKKREYFRKYMKENSKLYRFINHSKQ